MTKARARKSAVEKADIAIANAIDPALDKPAIKAIAAVGKIADEPPLFLASASLLALGLFSKNTRVTRSAASMMLAHGIAIALKTLGKNSVERVRPEAIKRGSRIYRMQVGKSQSKDLRSFPSGHAAGAIALASAFGRHFPQYRAPAYVAAASLGIPQIARRAHFASDVAAGAIVGAVAEDLGNRFLAALQRRLPI